MRTHRSEREIVMNRFIVGAAVAAAGACLPWGCENATAPGASQEAQAPQDAQAGAPDIPDLPAGTYRLDMSHASLVFHVNHLGFSDYTGAFDAFDATLELDPENPAAAKATAVIDLNSLRIPAPPSGFREELLSAQWLGAVDFPEMTFESTSVTPTGPASADIVGTLTLKGAVQPVTLHAQFNGGWAGHEFDPAARIGFSAHGALKRSAFGVSIGVPEPGSTMGVSDDVAFEIEAEFTGPAWTPGTE
jgi:polyisoprenoid-binding protein YceI